MSKYRFSIQWLDEPDTLTSWEFYAPDAETATWIGRGKAFLEDWTATNSESSLELL
jgi:hypothetical protein